MKKVLIVADNVEHGGIATVVNSFLKIITQYCTDISIDFLVYEEPKVETIERFKTLNSKVFVIPSVSKRPIRFVYNLYKVIKNNGRYDAVHLHNAYFIWIAAIAAKMAGVKNIIGHAHGSKGKTESKIFEILAFIGRIFNPVFCTKMFACAEKSGKWTFGKNYEFLPNVVSLENFQDCDKSEYYSEFKLSEDKKIIGYVGVFELEKNAEFVADIMNEFQVDDNYYCISAGDGSRFSVADERVRLLNVQDRLKFIGYRNDGIKLMQFFDVLVSPSFSEGMSLSILEAQMLGVPCVVSKGVPITNDLKMGLYYVVDDYNPKNWKKAIIDAVENGCSMSFEERNQHLSDIHYDEQSVAMRLINAYRGK